MAKIGEVVQIGAFNLERKIGDIVEVLQGTTTGIVHVGQILEIIKDENGVTTSLKVIVLA